MHEPGARKVTLVPASEHAPDEEAASIENVTGFPEPPPVAASVYEPPTDGSEGGVEVNVTTCGVFTFKSTVALALSPEPSVTS
jgi:hypothetical protein